MCERSVSEKTQADGVSIRAINEFGDVVGYAFVTLPDMSGTAVLDTINVQKCDRGKGFGEMLISRVIDISCKNGASNLTGKFRPETGEEKRVQSFYCRHGFEIHDDGTLSKKLDS